METFLLTKKKGVGQREREREKKRFPEVKNGSRDLLLSQKRGRQNQKRKKSNKKKGVQKRSTDLAPRKVGHARKPIHNEILPAT